MNSRIASILKDRIAEFSYVDKVAGLVRTIEYERAGEVIKIPVASDVEDALACDDSMLREMVPNSSYQAIVYFEDRGFVPIRSRTRGLSYQSRLRLVCWVNGAKFSGDPDAAAKIEQQFHLALSSGTYNFGPFAGVRHSVEGVAQKGHAIFSAYTYPDSARQYLLPPYDAFAIDVLTTLRVLRGCEDQVTVGNDECWTPPTTKRRRNPSEFTCEELLDPITGLTDEQLGPGCLNCSGGSCTGVDILDNLGNVIAHVNDGGTYTITPMILPYADKAAALADTATIPTTAQMVRIEDTNRAYFGAPPATVADLVTAEDKFLLPVVETSKGINTTVVATLVGVQLTDPT